MAPDPIVPLALKALDAAREKLQSRRKLRVLVHRAYFLSATGAPVGDEQFFIKVTNLSRDRDLEISHVWFATDPQVHVLNPARTMPARLRPDETFETWISVGSLPDVPEPEWLVRVLMSNGVEVESRPNWAVPSKGYVAGGGSS